MDQNKDRLSFKPLSDGLGFHPFSDGLPYAPVTKRTGSSAQSSRPNSDALPSTPGRPRPQRAQTPNPVPAIPTKPSSNSAGAIAAGPPRVAQPQPTVSKSVITPPAPPAAALVRSSPTQYGIGYVARRVAAYTMDTALNLAICAAAFTALTWKFDLDILQLFTREIFPFTVVLFAFLNWSLLTMQEIVFSTSFGKRLFGLSLEGSAVAIFLRAFFFVISVAFGGLGILWPLVDTKRRCWHDLAVNLQPT